MEKQMVELFSGSREVSKTFEKHGWKSFSVDNDPKLKPSMCCDILTITSDLLPRCVNFIWASPDCSTFSRAANSGHWDKTIIKYRVYKYEPLTLKAFTSYFLLEKTIDIINFYPGVLFVIENPIGRIHHLHPMKTLGHYRYAVNYADFGFGYSKETYLFSNMFLPFSTKKVHSAAPGLRTINGKYKRSCVPGLLVEEIIKHIP